jgi:uncharacterized protein (DUF305 family)
MFALIKLDVYGLINVELNLLTVVIMLYWDKLYVQILSKLMVFNVLGKKKNVDLMFVQIMIHHSQNIVIVRLKMLHVQHLGLVV